MWQLLTFSFFLHKVYLISSFSLSNSILFFTPFFLPNLLGLNLNFYFILLDNILLASYFLSWNCKPSIDLVCDFQ
uniref:Uncharacterized protein n=1 Tax=Octopus bimaculoides TaxID=37653 RepID=A0A0L8HQR8_OCTBM